MWVAAQRSAAAAAREEARARAHAEAAGEAKDEFLTVLAHELRAPLSAILAWVEVLRSGGLASDEIEHGLDAIERSGRLQARIISDILDLARIARGKFRLELAPCDPMSAVASVVNGLRPVAGAKRIRIRATGDPVEPIIADVARLEQIVWNLVSNAVKFSPERSTVEVQLREAGSHLEIRVSDDGRGIAPEFLPRVFDQFSQADTSSARENPGLGLGLAIARDLVELHGGTIAARSDGEGKGATFAVTLPVSRPEESSAPAP